MAKKAKTEVVMGGLEGQTRLTPPQWVQCDLRNFKLPVLGKFTVVMADPPWDIHMELPYGTMSDDEMRCVRTRLFFGQSSRTIRTIFWLS